MSFSRVLSGMIYSNTDDEILYKNTSYLQIDRMVNASFGKLTGGISPMTVTYAFTDWWMHILKSPGKQMELIEDAAKKYTELLFYAGHSISNPIHDDCAHPRTTDNRFDGPEWKLSPFDVISQGFLQYEDWLTHATTTVRGVSQHHLDIVSFTARQILDIFSPSNYILTNPEILKETINTAGTNLKQGYINLLEDQERVFKGLPPIGTEKYVLGKTIAITPGKVVFRNHIMELIQYTPTTKKVHPEPILIIPAWIMKYYILDLSPGNSFVKYLVDQGHTVFIISWRNLTSRDRDVRMRDYREEGLMKALEIVRKICNGEKVHAVGYCLGGTLLAIGAAHMSRDKIGHLKSVTLLAAQVDFKDAGELTLFIDDSQVNYLEDIMWQQGVLDSKQLSGAFQMLNTNDLIWSHIIKSYLMGKREEMFDLMAWNVDSTRLPYKMHSQYLRQLFLDNDLAEGRYPVGERPVALSDIDIPMFVVATTKDHISPWRSVYKIHLLTHCELTFLLTSGGHNAGIISVANHSKRTYKVKTKIHGLPYIDPDKWQDETPEQEGTWWPEWLKFVKKNSSQTTPAPRMGLEDTPIITDAPGTYVLEK